MKATHPQLLVLQVSASFVEPGDRAHGLDSGADAYLTQPLETTELLATVRALLRLRAAEQAARESGELYKVIVESASDYAIITTDFAGVIRTWSSGAEQVLGYSAAEMVGRSMDALFTAEDLAAAVRRLPTANGRSATAARSTSAGRCARTATCCGRAASSCRCATAAADTTGFIVILRDRRQRRRTRTGWSARCASGRAR